MYNGGKYSEFINYFVYNNLWQMQSVFLNIISPFFQCILRSSQAFLSHLWRKFLAVIKATYALHS